MLVGASGQFSSIPSAGAATALEDKVVREAGTLPNPKHPAGTDLVPEIEHFVVLMMENHSFDNILGLIGRGDGFTLGT